MKALPRDHQLSAVRERNARDGQSRRSAHGLLLHPALRLAGDRVLLRRRARAACCANPASPTASRSAIEQLSSLFGADVRRTLRPLGRLALESDDAHRRRLQLRAARPCRGAQTTGAALRGSRVLRGRGHEAPAISPRRHGAHDSGVRAAAEASRRSRANEGRGAGPRPPYPAPNSRPLPYPIAPLQRIHSLLAPPPQRPFAHSPLLWLCASD